MKIKYSPFETLLHDYSIGAIDFAAYRHKRAILIQDITLDKTEKNKKELTIPKLKNSPRDSSQAPAYNREPFIIPTINRKKPRLNRLFLRSTVVIGLVFTAGFAWYISEHRYKIPKDENKTQTVTDKESLLHKSNIENPSFITSFVDNPDWDSEAISNFLVQWQSLSPSQQNTVRQGNSFLVLGGILKDKIQNIRLIRNQKVTTKPTTPTRKENLLIWFSSQLSIGIN